MPLWHHFTGLAHRHDAFMTTSCDSLTHGHDAFMTSCDGVNTWTWCHYNDIMWCNTWNLPYIAARSDRTVSCALKYTIKIYYNFPHIQTCFLSWALCIHTKAIIVSYRILSIVSKHIFMLFNSHVYFKYHIYKMFDVENIINFKSWWIKLLMTWW